MPIACEQIRNEFSALLDDELNSEDRELVEEHLSECAECLRELHGYKQVSDVYFYHHPVKAPDNFDELLKEALAPAPSSTGMGWSPWRMAAAAAIVLVAGGIGWRTLQDSPERTMILSSNLDQREPEAQSAPAEAPLQGATEAAIEQASTAASQDLMEGELSAPPAALGGRGLGATSSGFGGGGGIPEVALEAEIRMNPSSPPADAPSLPEAGAPARSRKMEQSDGVSIQAAPPAPAPTTAPTPTLEEAVPEAKNDSANAPLSENEVMADADDVPAEEPRRSLLKQRMADESPSTAAVAPAEPVQWRAHQFSLTEGVLTQHSYGQEPLSVVEAPSEAWTQLLDAHPDLAQLVDGTQDVIVRLDETWYRIDVAPRAPEAAATE